MTQRNAVAALAAALAASAFAADPPEPPRDVGLLERTSARLAQIDVSVTGPRNAIEGLTAAEFEVRVNRKLVPHFIVDDLCLAQPGVRVAAPAEEPVAATAPPETPKPAEATYLLYFDMPHLTQSGRRDSIDAAREMLPKLLAGGHRAMIVVGAADLKTVVPLTSDQARLEAALVKMINDQATYDTYAATEEKRLTDIVVELDRGVHFALALANRYAADERWRQERDLRRLSMVLGRLGEVDPPKAVLYFADTMRQNAGQHYLSFFNETTLRTSNGTPVPDADSILTNAAMGALPLDRVMNEASGLGIRFYTVEGQGMTGMNSFIQSRSPSSLGGGGASANQAALNINFQRTRDAQATLVSLAAETGGRAFLNGVTPSRMSEQILDDMSCVYLLSFDPRGFPEDAPLSVSVTIKRKNVRSTTRGRLVIQSDATRLTERVLSAFASPTTGGSTASVRVGLIPIDYVDGKFRARVQVAVAGSAVPGSTWDIGASLVSQGVVWQDGSGRIQVTLPNTPVIYEKDMDFAPGDFDLVAVAREVQTDTLASREIHGRWPNIDTELASLGPIAVSQRLPGGFLRNGKSQTQGAVIVADDEVLRRDTPTAVIALVCRAKDQKRPLKVVRILVGEDDTPVGTTELDLRTDRCAQVVDLIPQTTLGAGRYRFVITVLSDGQELARGERTLVVPEKPPAPAKGVS